MTVWQRIRWTNVARLAAALVALVVVTMWPRLASPPPEVPPGTPVPVAADPAAGSSPAIALHEGPDTRPEDPARRRAPSRSEPRASRESKRKQRRSNDSPRPHRTSKRSGTGKSGARAKAKPRAGDQGVASRQRVEKATSRPHHGAALSERQTPAHRHSARQPIAAPPAHRHSARQPIAAPPAQTSHYSPSPATPAAPHATTTPPLAAPPPPPATSRRAADEFGFER